MKQLLRIVFGTNVASLPYLLRGKPDRFAQAALRAFRGARDEPYSSPLDIPTIRLAEILAGRRPRITLPISEYEDGMLPTNELLTLLGILVAEEPKEVLEIGTFMGYTARQMAETLPTATINTVDLPDGFGPEGAEASLPKDDWHLIASRVVGREFLDSPVAARICQHRADTATWDFREAGHPTFFFIDGSHTYEHAKHDSEQCYALCGGNGVFLWHDCDPTHPGVLRALGEWRAMGRDVKRIAGTTLAYWKASSPVR
ncbi:MAG TPA: class I SAM-dependent methyltransferase [Gemmatimonadaceae bacterium]|jgi:hypothetical protein|nr:class I SAM-dependent methyltransferase [Gemmatimonadaceae bacterium]